MNLLIELNRHSYKGVIQPVYTVLKYSCALSTVVLIHIVLKYSCAFNSCSYTHVSFIDTHLVTRYRMSTRSNKENNRT